MSQNRSTEQPADPMAPVLRSLYAERLSGMPPDFHNQRRDLFEEVEHARRGVPREVVERAQSLIDEIDEWEAGRVRPQLEAVGA